MYKTISRLPLTLTSFAVITTLYGCSATLPSHDGSLHSVYGIDSTAPEEATTLTRVLPKQTVPVESYVPTVQTISGTGVIASSPITAIVVEEHNPEESEIIASKTSTEIIQAEPAPILPKDREHKLGAGETLFSVAGDLTGSSHNWKAIADYNSIADPGAITVGQSIVIPGKLLIEAVNDKDLSSAFEIIETIKTEQKEDPQPNIIVSANGTQEIELAALETVAQPVLAPETQSNKTFATNNSSGLTDTSSVQPKGSLKNSIANFASIITTSFTLPTPVAAISSPAVQSSATVMTPVKKQEPKGANTTIQTAMLDQEIQPKLNLPVAMQTNSIESRNPAVELQNADPKGLVTTPPVAKQSEQWVQVDGNFTPKAIYKGAGYTTGLLMRVSPGTKFKLTSKTDDWYEIETNQGTGYIFHRDILLPE